MSGPRIPSRRFIRWPSAAFCWRGALALLILSAHVAFADDWPQWRGPRRDGVSLEKNWNPQWGDQGPKILWRADVGTGCASLAVAGGLVYTMGNVKEGKVNTDFVFCLDAQSGHVVWTFGFPYTIGPDEYAGASNATPCVAGNFVYIVGCDGRAICFEARTGNVVWNTPGDEKLDRPYKDDMKMGGLSSSPLVQGDFVIAGTRALDKKTGKVAWQINEADHLRWASPVSWSADGHDFILCLNRFGLSAVNLTDGTRAWHFPCASDSCSAAMDPVVYEGHILFATRPLRRGDPATFLLDVAGNKPTVIWQTSLGVSNYQQRVIWENYAYSCDAHTWTHGDATLKCMDLKTGQVKWSEPDYDWGEVAIADGKLLILRYGELSIVEATPKQFHLLAKARLVKSAKLSPMATPVLANGLLYCRGAQGDLACLDMRVAPRR